MEQELSRGAEATIVRVEDHVYKRREPKHYRNAQLDTRLRRARTKREQKVIASAHHANIPVPTLFDCDEPTTIKMSFVEGKRLRDELIEHPENRHHLQQVGQYIATLHDADIIHGDLTTSNILVTPEQTITLIDFGLAEYTNKIEDKAVDIHLLKQALESTHYQHTTEFYEQFMKGYSTSQSYEEVMQRIKTVQARGRNKK